MFDNMIESLMDSITDYEALLVTNEEEREALWERYCDLEELQYAAIKREEAALAS